MVTKVKRVTGGGAGLPVQQQRAAGHSLPALEQRAGHAQQGRAERVCSAAHPGGRLQGPCQWSCCTPVSLKKRCNIFKDCKVLCGQQLRVRARLPEVIAGCQQQRQTCLRSAGARKRRGPGPGTAPGCSHRRGDAAHRQQQNAQGVPRFNLRVRLSNSLQALPIARSHQTVLLLPARPVMCLAHFQQAPTVAYAPAMQGNFLHAGKSLASSHVEIVHLHVLSPCAR